MDEIVRRLRNRPSDKLLALKESMPVNGINEADEDEIPKDDEEVDIPAEETPAEDNEPAPEEQEPIKKKVEPKIKSNNPLDNPYAVDYKIGDRVTISYTNGDHSKLSGYIEGYDKLGFYRVKWDSGRITNGFTDTTLSQVKDSVEEQKCVCGSTEFVNENSQIVCDRCGRLLENVSKIKESKAYSIRYNYDGDSLSDYQAHVLVVADSPEEAIKIAKVKIPDGRFFKVEDTFDSVSDFKTQFPQSNYKIIEGYKDLLTIADKQRPKGKRMIRSVAHPVSTAMSNGGGDIGESIRKAFKKKSLREESKSYKGYEIYSPTENDDYEVYIKKDGKDLLDKEGKRLQFNWISHAEEYIDSLNESEDDTFSRLYSLRGEFWTRKSEMIDDIYNLGYDSVDDNSEYVAVYSEDEEGEEVWIEIPIVGTSNTMTLDFDKAKIYGNMDIE